MQSKVNEKLFKDQPFYVGIDTHKKSWKVTIMSKTLEHKTISQNPVPDILASYLKRNFPGGDYYAVYEAGLFGFGSCRKLNELGIKCIVAHPSDVPAKYKEKFQKTDTSDSRKLARSLRGNDLEAIHIPDQKIEADRALMRQRFRIMKDLSRTKNRVKCLLFQFGIDIPEQFDTKHTRHWPNSFINWLSELQVQENSLKIVLENYINIGKNQRIELLSVTNQVKSLAETDAYKHNCLLLKCIPGIGLMTAMFILVQLNDIRRFSRFDDLCSYVGLVPSMYSSGDTIKIGEMVTRGRKELKIMLIEAAWIAIRKDPALMAKFNELSKRMHKNKAIIRIARKLLNRIRYVLINQKEYELGTVA
jgi:transposase